MKVVKVEDMISKLESDEWKKGDAPHKYATMLMEWFIREKQIDISDDVPHN